jgi:hypothetical protein
MKFSLVFENTGDAIPFEVKYNHELFEFFVEKSVGQNQNRFSDQQKIAQQVSKGLTDLHWALSNTNEVLYDLVGINFPQSNNLETYLDQSLLNRIHAEWVFSQNHKVQVHQLRFSTTAMVARLGQQLHDQFSDEISETRLAVAMQHLGKIFPYEDVNMAVHRLESFFTNTVEFNAAGKWEIFDNPFCKTSMVSNPDRMNLRLDIPMWVGNFITSLNILTWILIAWITTIMRLWNIHLTLACNNPRLWHLVQSSWPGVIGMIGDPWPIRFL